MRFSRKNQKTMTFENVTTIFRRLRVQLERKCIFFEQTISSE